MNISIKDILAGLLFLAVFYVFTALFLVMG